MLIDTHAHLDFPEFAGDLDSVLQRAKEAGVGKIIAIGTTLRSSHTAIHFAEQYPEIYAVVGIHPTSVSEEGEDFISELRRLADHPKVVAIGETGLDYHHLPSSLRKQEISEAAFGAASTETIESDLHDDAEMAAQSVAFEQHLELAVTLAKNVVIHQRDAWADTVKILGPYSAHLRGVFHCFNGSLEQAQEVVELGHYVSFTGIVTFKNAEDLRHTAASLPIDRVMVETDAPYLAPVPYRGKRCEPAFVRETAAVIATTRNLGLEYFSAETTKNAERFFGLWWEAGGSGYRFTSYVNGTSATVVKHMTSQPFRRIGKLEVVVTVPLPGDHPQRATLEKVALNRPFQKSLSPDLDIPVSFSWGDDL